MKNNAMRMLIALLSALLLANGALAANRYVRTGAAGNGSGTDWVNAYTQLPSSLVRGDTYFIADGNYGSYTFGDQPSGGTLITIRKATPASHGTDVGWQDSYGDGEALFTGSDTVWSFKPGVGYYDISGTTGSAGVSRSYGIRLYSTSSRNSAAALVMADTSGTYSQTGNNDTITLDRIDFDWNNGTSAGSSGATRAVQWNASNPSRNIKLSNCYLHHSSGFAVYAAGVGSNLIVDNCFVERNGGATSSHHETFWVTGTNGFRLSNSTIKDTLPGALTGWVMLGDVSNALIYNNVFTCSNVSTCSTGGNGIIATWDANQYANSNVGIYNNTFANLPTSGNPSIYFYHSGGAADSNVNVQNNIFFTGAFSVVGAATNGYAACGGGVSCPGTNSQTNLGTSIFLSWAAQDFRLAVATSPGIATQFSLDKLGTTRASDGSWDRGAFEFGGTAGAPVGPPSPPVNLVVR